MPEHDPPEGYVSFQFGILQERLQHGPLWRFGNALGTARWCVWRLRGGRYWTEIHGDVDQPLTEPEDATR